jgi:hypothetical protein
MTEINRPWVTERLKQSLQLLACASEIQLTKFPSFIHAPDEMALDFDNFRSAFVGSFRTELTSEQLQALELIDRTFKQMNKDCFNPEGLSNSAEWRRIRELASDALKAFGWPLGDPPRRDREFVPSRPRSKKSI